MFSLRIDMASYCSHHCLILIFVTASASTVTSEDRLDVSTILDPLHFEPWYNREDREEICDQVPYNILRCPNNLSVSIQASTCVTFDETKQLLEVGKCLYSHITVDKYPISEEGIMCEEMNRTGTLCGKCKDGHYPLAYSYDMNCVECPDGKSNWWKFVLVAFLPLTVFYFVVLLFNINLTSSYLLGFVFHAQSISLPALARPVLYVVRAQENSQAARVAFAVYGIWNLDFLRSVRFDICLGTDTLQTLALDLAVGFYPLLLMVLSYLLIHLYDRNFKPLVIIWKPFRAIFGLFQRTWAVKMSLIDSFAAFFLLSNVKFLSVSFDLLAPVRVYQLNSTGNLSISWRVYYNASLPYFGERHLPYAILAIAVLVFLMLLPILLLVLYPFRWFQKCLNLFPVRWYILHTFMDSFQGCYKDGTQPGTRDCRWLACMPFVSHLLMFVIDIFTFNGVFLSFFTITLVMFTIIMVNVDPFKNSNYTTTYSAFSLITAICFTSVSIFTPNESALFDSLIRLAFSLPLLYISAITSRWMYRHMRSTGLRLISRLRAWRHGYMIQE